MRRVDDAAMFSLLLLFSHARYAPMLAALMITLYLMLILPPILRFHFAAIFMLLLMPIAR